MESDALVLVVDEDEACRQLLARTLETHGFSVVEAESGEEALELARRPGLVAAILEIPLAGLSGYELCQQLKAEHGSDVAVIFLSGVRTEPYDRVAGLLVGGDDYLVKPFSPGELVTRLGKLVGRLATRPGSAHLTRREHEILELMGQGLAHAEIARRLFISPKTVATHVEHILRKLGVRSRAQAIAVAYRDGILHPGHAAPLPPPPDAALSAP
jgi:DNA-binding NarL/FixJ family response regulator